jgi:multidrug efflux pump subunit AcrB
MVIGMLPMATEAGQNTPLGRAVIGGLIFATCATLLLVPTIFSLVHGHQNANSDQADAPPSPSH